MASRTAQLLSPLARQLRPRAFRAATSRATRFSPSTISFVRQPFAIRAAHTIPRPPPPQTLSTSPKADEFPAEGPDDQAARPLDGPLAEGFDEPKSESERPDTRGAAYYQISFTCVPCEHRSHHNISKQGYHTGSVLITCPECRNRHVISDHLDIFGDRKLTVEDLMREKGRLVKRGTLGEDGDIELWPEDLAEQQVGEPLPDPPNQ